MAARFHNVFVGSETGLLKGVNTTQKYFQNLNGIGGLDREQEIKLMSWGNPEETEICCGLKNREVKLYDRISGSFNVVIEAIGGEGPLKGLDKYNGYFLTCTESGLVKVWDENDKDGKIEFNVGKNICKMRQNKQKPSYIATGGKENEVKIWDLENTKRPIFIAKNVANDFLDHRVPIWVTDMQFIPNSEKFVVCTGYHHIRLYDPKSPQKRPIVNMEFDEYPLTALSLTHNENYVIVGNSRGRMGLFDLRKRLLVHCFKGFAGSIRSIECHPKLPLVASCGLDRFLRIHDIETHQLLHKVYLKSRLNCLLFSAHSKLENSMSAETALSAVDKEGVEENEENDLVQDELWEKMEDVSDDEEKIQSVRNDKTQQRSNKVRRKNMKRIKIGDNTDKMDSGKISSKKDFLRKSRKRKNKDEID